MKLNYNYTFDNIIFWIIIVFINYYKNKIILIVLYNIYSQFENNKIEKMQNNKI